MFTLLTGSKLMSAISAHQLACGVEQGYRWTNEPTGKFNIDPGSPGVSKR